MIMNRQHAAAPALAAITLASAAPFWAVRAQPGRLCNAPAADSIVYVALPANPFTPVATPDGCWIFVAMIGNAAGSKAGVAVLSRGGGTIKLERTVPLRSGGSGAVLTHDARTLIVAAGMSVAFLDAARLESGRGEPVLGYLNIGDGVGAIYVNVTRDDRTLFVALERASAILVVDLEKVRAGTFDTTAVVGRIPVGIAPIALALSNDEKYMYTTSQAAPPAWSWPIECRPEADQTAPPNHTKGAVVVIDVERARSDPANAAIARVPVGCNPVRLVLSPDGNTAWLSVRGEHSLAAMDTRKLLTDPSSALIAKLPVGTAPVGVAVFDDGKRVVATNSNRFAGGAEDRQSLNVVDVSSGAASAKLVGTIPAGAFPRELRVTPDGNTLLATNFASKTLEIVDLRRLPIEQRRRH